METLAVKKQKLGNELPTERPNEVIESQTKKIPNLVFLALAGLSIAGSAYLTFRRKQGFLGNFTGLWAPTMLILGVYNKLVKVEEEVLQGHASRM
jgi:hypothetical protein